MRWIRNWVCEIAGGVMRRGVKVARRQSERLWAGEAVFDSDDMPSALRRFVDWVALQHRDEAIEQAAKAAAIERGKLEKRIARLEQFHCEHEFSDHNKGCTQSILCSKCGALHPDWEWWGGMALPERDDAVWAHGQCYVPKPKEAP